MFCEKCGKQVKDGQKFCDGCGADLEAQRCASAGTASAAEEMHVCCPKCGKQALDDDKFCTGCGASLEGVPPIPVAAPASAPNVEMHVYCPKCGMQALDDDKFCTGCGTTLEGVAPTPAPATKKTAPNTEQNASAGAGAAAASPHVEKKPKKEKPPKEPKEPGFYQKHKVLFWILMALLILLIAAACVFFFVIKPRMVNLNDYVSVRYSGRNTVATATVEVDQDRLARDLGYIQNGQAFEPGDKEFGAILDCLDWKVSPDKKLKNGDEVTVTCTVDDSGLKPYKFIFTGKKKTELVKGLGKYDTFDPFENIDVEVGGMEPDGTAKVKAPKAEEEGLTVTLDKTSGLSNGDTVTVTIAPAEEKNFDEYGEKHKKTPERNPDGSYVVAKEFKVTGLRRAARAGDVPESYLNQLCDNSKSVIRTSGTKGWRNKNLMGSITTVDSYWSGNDYVVINEVDFDYAYAPSIYQVHHYSYYTYVKYKNISEKDGSYSYSDVSIPSGKLLNMYDDYGSRHYVSGWSTASAARNHAG